MIAPSKSPRNSSLARFSNCGKRVWVAIVITIFATVASVILQNIHDRVDPINASAKFSETNDVSQNARQERTKPNPIKPPDTVIGKETEFQKKPGTMRLPNGRVLTFPPPRENEFRIIHSHGAIYKCDHLGNWEDITPKPIFDNTFEETLLGLATTGTFMPGLLLGLDHDEAIKMLTKPVVINDNDSDEVVAKKQAIADAKEAILDYMKDGASLDDFVMEMRKQVVKERYIKSMALKEVVALLKEGRTEEASDMRDAANKLLERETGGVIQLPDHIEQALEDVK